MHVQGHQFEGDKLNPSQVCTICKRRVSLGALHAGRLTCGGPRPCGAEHPSGVAFPCSFPAGHQEIWHRAGIRPEKYQAYLYAHALEPVPYGVHHFQWYDPFPLKNKIEPSKVPTTYPTPPAMVGISQQVGKAASPFDYSVTVIDGIGLKVCECGAEKADSPKHSPWCKKYEVP